MMKTYEKYVEKHEDEENERGKCERVTGFEKIAKY